MPTGDSRETYSHLQKVYPRTVIVIDRKICLSNFFDLKEHFVFVTTLEFDNDQGGFFQAMT